MIELERPGLVFLDAPAIVVALRQQVRSMNAGTPASLGLAGAALNLGLEEGEGLGELFL